ncbi:hypothetical protein V6N12_025826 [Hibiscus sabdariffa]|uniref:Uncharacterized protein n=1 Tax=Hibiscus sabdariffa TaxID=183260 RepID=A0ABR2DQ48_9ROSI
MAVISTPSAGADAAKAEGFTIVENRTAGIIQESHKRIKKKSSGSAAQNEAAKLPQKQQQVQIPVQADQEIQLKASRDMDDLALCFRNRLQMAMAAKAKLLFRELKIVRTDLAFAKERCAQLEEENRNLRENGERRNNPENDELVCFPHHFIVFYIYIPSLGSYSSAGSESLLCLE